MSWLDGMVEENEALSQNERLGRTADKPAPGAFTGALDVLGPSLLRGGLEAGAAVESGFSSLWQGGLDAAASVLLPEPKFGGKPNVTSAEESSQETLGQGTAQAVMDLRPDPAEVGVVGQILGEAAAVLPRTVVGTVLAGPLGAGVAAGGPAGYSSKQVGMAEGLDESTATLKGVIDAATVGVGAVLPAARFVKPVLGDAAIAVGANVGLGMAGRGATAELLDGGGYHAQAAQYRAMDGTAIAADAILGAAFFGLGRVGLRRPTTEQVDAALSERTYQHADIDTAPGAPIDPKSAAAHQEAIHTAINQLSRGEPVEVPAAVREAEFLKASSDNSPLQRGADAIRGELQAIETRSVGDDFAARVGRDTEYDSVGAAVFRDGTAYPLRDAARFFDQHVATTSPKDGAAMPDVLFSIGRVDDNTFQGLTDYLPGFNENLREARISARTIKHIQDSRPEIVKEVLDRLERGVLHADEILPNHQNPSRALLVLKNIGEPQRAGGAKHQSTVIELSANGKGVDVVTAMTMPDRTLNKARALKAKMEASRSEGPHPSSSSETGQSQEPHAAAASEDFLQVDRNTSADSISKVDEGATDPVIQVADDILNRMDDIRISTGALDADGNPITVSARELMAQADADIVRAEEDSRGFAAAATCFLQRGDV